MSPLKAGDPAPDFSLQTPFGAEVTLRPLLRDGPVAVEFIRGTWDPNSRQRLRELGEIQKMLRERYGTRCIVVSCERSITAREYLEGHPGAYSLVIDEEQEVTRRYGVFQRFSFGAFHLARPATFVVDRCCFIRLARVGSSPITFTALEDIIAALDELKSEAPSD